MTTNGSTTVPDVATSEVATPIPAAKGVDRLPIHSVPSVWDRERHPWVTFADAVRVDDILRRQDAMLAILHWPSASPALLVAAHAELRRAEEDGDDWNDAIDAIETTWFAV